MPAQASPINLLLVGASGYIGGTILSHLCSEPSTAAINILALVRNPADAKAIATSYPQVQTLLGDLGNEELLHDAAAESDMVIYAARNTQDGVQTLMTGLAAGTKSHPEGSAQPSRRNRRALFIMLSAIISLADPENLRLGEPPLESSKPTSDVDDRATIASLPDHHWHVAQERAFLQLASEKGRRVITPVVMSLPLTVGDGTGPVRRRGFVHAYAQALRRREGKKPFVMGQGRNVWSWSSPRDLATAVAFVLDVWMKDKDSDDLEGHVFVESGQLEMRQLASYVGQALGPVSEENRVASADECEPLQYPQFAELMPELPGLWGVTARCQADRLRGKGWKPVKTRWEPLVDECVRSSCV
ncbi:NAD(P)-binding protein [Colletotrichum falcatum]|nr:NAD(P)-binding protein [Colletotrichum falcatum]